MENKRVQQTWLGLAWLLLSLVINFVSAQGSPVGVQKGDQQGVQQGGVRLVETRADDHSGTNEPPRDKRYFAFSGFHHPQPFPQPVSFNALNNYNQQQNQFGRGRTGSKKFAPDVIDTHANNQYFNTFNQMMSSPHRNFNGRTGNRPTNNMSPWGYGDWSQWGWPSNNGFWGRSYGSWGQQNQQRPWGGQAGGNSGKWNQFGGRSVSGPWNQFGGRSGRSWPSYNQYGYGYPYGIRG